MPSPTSLMIVIAANVTFGGPNGIYATDVIFVQRLSLFFNEGYYRPPLPSPHPPANLHFTDSFRIIV